VRRGEQPPWIVPDGLWQRIEPLLPKPPGIRRVLVARLPGNTTPAITAVSQAITSTGPIRV
jgi:hypothetical protein